MAKEGEQSLQKRPDLVPEQLKRGGLIVGVEHGIQGSLMSVTGAALERITRERTEVPPELKLPERPVYFLDPNTRRLIMISNRENRGENKTPDKYGLFAEIVELDEEGKPHYRLSTSEIILPDENYHLVAVGPNKYGLPPSDIDVVEEEEGGKKKFVPWNLWLGNLQNWMNEVSIDPNEDLATFVRRFSELRKQSKSKAETEIAKAFPSMRLQGINDKTVPLNVIIGEEEPDSVLVETSMAAGLYPVALKAKQLAEFYDDIGGWIVSEETKSLEDVITGHHGLFDIHKYLTLKSYVPFEVAVLTLDVDVADKVLRERENNGERLYYIATQFREYNPIFSFVTVRRNQRESAKLDHGHYNSRYDKEQYRGLLNKLKADLILTMFLRGGAPLTK